MQASVDEAGREAHWQSPDWRRSLQLLLATAWLLDGVLQLQPFMFTGGSHGFSQMLAGTATGNPQPVASSIVWAAGMIGAHRDPANLAFALIQILLGLGIAWRTSMKIAMAASIPWALAVWWFGEGLGGVLHGAGAPVIGGPGAVLVYAALAVVLWPRSPAAPSERSAPGGAVADVRWQSAASAAGGARLAKVIWAALWSAMALLSLLGAARSPSSIGSAIAGVEVGEPGWLAHLDHTVAAVASGHGLVVAVVLAVAFGLVAVGPFLPPAAARWTLALGIAVSLALWVVTENFGAILAGGATDPNSGPLLVVLALAYWPVGVREPAAVTVRSEPALAAPEVCAPVAPAAVAGAAAAGLAGTGLSGVV